MPRKNKGELQRRDVSLDNENWNKLEILASLLPGKPSISGLIRDAIQSFLREYEQKIDLELKRRTQETMRKVVKFSKRGQQTNDKSAN